MNILPEFKMMIFGIPRSGSRSLTGFFKDAYDYRFRTTDLSKQRFPVNNNRIHHWVPTSLDPYYKPDRQKLKSELNLILNPEYRDYTWISLMRHPLTRFKSVLNWYCNSGSETMRETGSAAFTQPEKLKILHDYHVMHHLNQIRKINYWLRVEHLAEDLLKIPRFQKDAKNIEKVRKSIDWNFGNNWYRQPEKDQLKIKINDLPPLVGEYLYKEYYFIYEKFGYEKFPEDYEYDITSPFATQSSNTLSSAS